MRLSVTRIFLLVLLLGVSFSQTNAQSIFDNWPGFIKNYEFGYGYSHTWAKREQTIQAVREDGKFYDTTFKRDVSSKIGISANAGTSINLKRLGEKSQLALGISYVYNLYTWDYPTANGVSLTDTGVKLFFDQGLLFSGVTLNTGLALSADFKFGAEAMLDKRYRWSWAGGAGVIPSVNLTADFDDADLTFGVQPFVKTEVSVRGPISLKLRVMYAFLDLKYIDVKNGKGFFQFTNAANSTLLTGKGNFTVSAIIMPFTWMYKKSEWYNTY